MVMVIAKSYRLSCQHGLSLSDCFGFCCFVSGMTFIDRYCILQQWWFRDFLDTLFYSPQLLCRGGSRLESSRVGMRKRGVWGPPQEIVFEN